MFRRLPSWSRQFRLQTFLLLVAIISGWLAFELKFVRERRAALADPLLGSSPEAQTPGVSVPWVRRLLGDYAVSEVVLFEYDPKKLAHLKSMFPEAEIRHACSLEFEHEFWSRFGVAVP